MTNVKNDILTNPVYFNATVKMLDHAHTLRMSGTESEDILWQRLRNRRLIGLKFRRQHAISGFVADFYCHEARLVVEVDGSIHNTAEQKERDENRTFELQKLGLNVIRVTNDEVMNNVDAALDKIKTLATSPSPFGEGAGGEVKIHDSL
ncbi:MAG: endonuclease domain-containing protein [Bacteroidota bacterium]|nr:endonuclease domain-containing protein [Bacteroidota bacterium]